MPLPVVNQEAVRENMVTQRIGDLETLLCDADANPEAVKAAFAKLDTDGDGWFEREELTQICRQFKTLGFGSSPVELDKLMNRLDADGDGRIDFEEFVAACGKSGGKDAKNRLVARGASAPAPDESGISHCLYDQPEGDMIDSHVADQVSANLINDIGAFLHTSADVGTLRVAFQKMDTDGGGSLSHDELAQVLKRFRRFGFKATDKELNALMKYLDADGNGTIDFEEFVAMVRPPDKKPMPPRNARRSGGNHQSHRQFQQGTLDFSGVQSFDNPSSGCLSYRDKFREDGNYEEDDWGTPRARKWVPAHWTSNLGSVSHR